MPQSDAMPPVIKNPSRETCENIIRRILMTEVLHQGKNNHFKHATDFMNYFESLYPASDSLAKQVQRAVKAMNLPKDEKGYYIINKTQEQIRQDTALREMFALADAKPMLLDHFTPIFLAAKPALCPYLKELLLHSATFQDKILTILETSNGLMIYTDQPKQLEKLCSSLINNQTND